MNEGQKIDINGLGIYYEKHGTGSLPVLILPGGTGERNFMNLPLFLLLLIYTEEWPHFDSLPTGSIDTDIRSLINNLDKRKYTIVALDPTGYGKSRPPARDYKLGVGLYKLDADISVELMKKLGFPSFSFMGWSDGGRVGLVAAINYPGAIDKLITWGSAPVVTSRQQMALESSRNLQVWDRVRRDAFFAAYGEEEAKEMWGRHVNFYKSLHNICREKIHEIRCPTLILHGDRDPVEKSLAEEMSHKISDSQLQTWPDGGHDIHITYLKDFVKRVERFLDE